MVVGLSPGDAPGLSIDGGAAVAGLLGQFESWLERAVEGGSRALFRQRLQPIELAKAASRAMQSQRLIGPEGVEVPNAFAIALHPDDLEELAPYQSSLEARIARYLSGFADERGLIPVGAVSVTLLADPQLRRRALRVDAQMADPHIGPSTRPVAPIGSTELLPRIVRTPASPSAPVDEQTLVLVLEDGRQVAVPHGSLRIGRALDNDLVIADSRVSRYHAQIVRDAHGPLVRDLGSTNGTAVAGRTIGEDRLADGDRLSLGGYQIEVRLAPPAGPPPNGDWR
jgi:hypothetical protein